MCSLSPALLGPGPVLCLFHLPNFVCVFVDRHVWLLNDYFIHACMLGLSQPWNPPPKGGRPWGPTDHVSPPRHSMWNYICTPHTQLFHLGFESPSLGPHSHPASTSQAEPSLQPPFPGLFPPRILFLPLTQCGPKVTLPALERVFDSILVTFGGNGSESTHPLGNPEFMLCSTNPDSRAQATQGLLRLVAAQEPPSPPQEEVDGNQVQVDRKGSNILQSSLPQCASVSAHLNFLYRRRNVGSSMATHAENSRAAAFV